MARFTIIVSKFPVVRAITGIALKGSSLAARIWSHMRFHAILKDAGNSNCHWTVEIKYPENIRIGDSVSIGPYCCLGAKSPIIIENYVRISRGVQIETARLAMREPPPYRHTSRPITIRQGAWIGTNAILLGGVEIGEGAIIGAGVVVRKDVPPGAVIVGAENNLLECEHRVFKGDNAPA